MTVVIILGNRVNNDGTMSKIQEERLLMALEIEQMFHPDYYIVSGGMANKKANVTEAFLMSEYLKNNGIDSNKIILEDQSLSTIENASFSIPIAKKLGADTIVICTSAYHLCRAIYNTFSLFVEALGEYDAKVLTYTKTSSIAE